jgi:dihydroorotase
VDLDAKTLPFAEAEPGATGLELLLSLSIKWAQECNLPLMRALEVVTAQPAKLLGQVAVKSGLGHLQVGAWADVVVFDPQAHWQVVPEKLHSQGKHTPFAFDMSGAALPAQVKATWVGGRLTYQA